MGGQYWTVSRSSSSARFVLIKIYLANYPSLPGKLLTRAWLESQPLPGQPSSISPNQPPTRFWGPNREPLIVRPEDGGFSSLGGHLPPKDLTVQDVANLVGSDRMVDVIGMPLLAHIRGDRRH